MQNNPSIHFINGVMHMIPLRPVLLILLFYWTTAASRLAAQDTLSPLEQDMAAFVDAHNQEALALLERAVNINSGTMNFEGVRQVGALFRQELESLGFETTWVDGEAFGRAGQLVAERPGAGPHVLLIGHLDTVFEPDSPFQHFELVNDSTARGPGVTDMKGGNVIILQALSALSSIGALDDLHVTVVLMGDEEKSGRPITLARAALVEAARAADIAIGFEDGDGNPRTAVIARRGSTTWRLDVRGRPSHSSQVFSESIGAGAVYEAARILYAFYAELGNEPYLTFNPGLMLGGTEIEIDTEQARGDAFGKNNVVAEHAAASGDLRALSVEQREAAKERMQAIVHRNLPHTSAALSFDDSYPPMAPSDGNHRLLSLYDQVSRDLGLGPVEAVDPARAGAADVSFTAEFVQMAIDGIGLMGTGGHTVDEMADLRTLPSQTKRAAILLYRLAAQGVD